MGCVSLQIGVAVNINLEQTILRNLLTNDDYMRKVLPFIKPDYFDGVYRSLFKEVSRFVARYNKLPTLEAFKIEIDEAGKMSEDDYRLSLEILPNVFEAQKENLQWLLESTEKWCQDRAVYNAVMESISIMMGNLYSMHLVTLVPHITWIF